MFFEDELIDLTDDTEFVDDIVFGDSTKFVRIKVDTLGLRRLRGLSSNKELIGIGEFSLHEWYSQELEVIGISACEREL